MKKISVAYPNTIIKELNKISKEYLELRIHEFKSIVENINVKEKHYFYSEYKFHEHKNLASINILIHSSLNNNQKEYVSFHFFNNSLISIDDLIVIDKKVKKIITNFFDEESLLFDYNNFYKTEKGIIFIYFDDNQEKELLIEDNFLTYKLSIN